MNEETYLRALEEERDGYLRAGLKDRAQEVQDEIDRVKPANEPAVVHIYDHDVAFASDEHVPQKDN